jgi:hypothetical protein
MILGIAAADYFYNNVVLKKLEIITSTKREWSFDGLRSSKAKVTMVIGRIPRLWGRQSQRPLL